MGRVARYMLQRFLLTIPMIFILLTVVFLLLRVMPGDPVIAMLGGRNVTPDLLEEYRRSCSADSRQPSSLASSALLLLVSSDSRQGSSPQLERTGPSTTRCECFTSARSLFRCSGSG